MIYKFVINKNEFLATGVIGYFHQYYTGYKQPDNPDFINTLKNTYNSEPHGNLIAARDKVNIY